MAHRSRASPARHVSRTISLIRDRPETETEDADEEEYEGQEDEEWQEDEDNDGALKADSHEYLDEHGEVKGDLIVSDGARHMRNVYGKWPVSSSIVQVDKLQRRYNVEHHQVQINFYNKAAAASIAHSMTNMALNPVAQSVHHLPLASTAAVPDAAAIAPLKPSGAISARALQTSGTGQNEQVGMMKQPLFPRQDKDWNQSIRIVSIGVDSWFCDGDVPVGIRFEGQDVVTGKSKLFPCPVSMGTELAFALTLPSRGQYPNARKLLFEAKPPNRLNRLFPKWTEADAEVGVKEITLKDRPGKQYLLERPPLLPNGELVPNAPIQCPLGYFRMLVLPQDPNDVPLMMMDSYVIDESKYKRCVEQFKACVSDTRILTSMNDVEVHAYPTAKGIVKCSLVLDVYYTRVN